MGHARAADCFNKSFFNNAVFNIKRKLAGALLGSAPAHTVSETADVLDFLGLNPLALFGDGSGAVVGSLGYTAHFLYFAGIINHFVFLLSKRVIKYIRIILYQNSTDIKCDFAQQLRKYGFYYNQFFLYITKAAAIEAMIVGNIRVPTPIPGAKIKITTPTIMGAKTSFQCFAK